MAGWCFGVGVTLFKFEVWFNGITPAFGAWRLKVRILSLQLLKKIKMVDVFVNDVSVSVPNGSTVLQACEKSGAVVPRFC